MMNFVLHTDVEIETPHTGMFERIKHYLSSHQEQLVYGFVMMNARNICCYTALHNEE